MMLLSCETSRHPDPARVEEFAWRLVPSGCFAEFLVGVSLSA
jgi:hypothetical protein